MEAAVFLCRQRSWEGFVRSKRFEEGIWASAVAAAVRAVKIVLARMVLDIGNLRGSVV